MTNNNNNNASTTFHSLNLFIDQALSYQSSNQSNGSIPPRTRITRACDHCKSRKTKCDNVKPRCLQCVKRNDPCTFTTRVCKRGPKPKSYSYSYLDHGKKPPKSTNVYPYPTYFYSQANTNNDLNIQVRRFSCPQQPANTDYSLRSSSDYSSSITAEFEYHKLPPIQRNSSVLPPLISSKSLRLPSLAKALNLPPVRIPLNCESTFNDISSISKPISSPSIYKLSKNTINRSSSKSCVFNTNYKKILLGS